MPRTKPFKNLLQAMAKERTARIEVAVKLELLYLALLERKKCLGYTDEEIDWPEERESRRYLCLCSL